MSAHTTLRLVLVVVITALAIAMGFAVSTFLTSTVSDLEAQSVAFIVRTEAEDVGLDTLFEETGAAGEERWPDVLGAVVAHVPGVVRCKVWNRDRVVAWADDAALIGRHAGDDPALRAALAGRVVAGLVEPAHDDTTGGGTSLVLMRIFVPLLSKDTQDVRGVVEIRRVPSRLSDRMRTGLVLVWAIAAAGGVALLLAMRPLLRLVRDASPGQRPATTARTSEEIVAEIRERFGFVPPFFEPALDAPSVLENLWQQTLSAYVNNPLPALFKEKLFAYLSRYCAVPYCIVCHSCALRPLGMSAADVLALLESPPRREMEITADLTVLAAQPDRLTTWPEPGSPLEEALIHGSIFVFLHPSAAGRCHAEIRRLLGDRYAHLTEFLAYVKTCHFWVEAHPELAYEADQRAQTNLGALIEQEPRLADFFRDYAARVLRERESAEAQRLAGLEARAADLARANDPLGAEIRRAPEHRGPDRAE